MAEPVGSLRVDVEMNAAQIASDAGKVKAIVNSTAAQLQRGFAGVATSANSAFASFFSLRTAMAALAGGSVLAVVARFAKVGDEIAKTSERLGLTTTEFQELSYAATLAGLEQEQFSKAIEEMNKRLGETSDSVTGAEQALGKLGLRLSELRTLSPGEAFRQIAERVALINDPLQRATILADLFGRTGQRMANLVKEDLKAAADEAHRFGVILDEETVRKAEKASDEFDRMGKALTAIGVRASAEALPAITALRELLTSEAFQTTAVAVLNTIAKYIGVIAQGATITAEAFDKLQRDTKLRKLEEDFGKSSTQLSETLNMLEEARENAMDSGSLTAAGVFEEEIAKVTRSLQDQTRAYEEQKEAIIGAKQAAAEPIARKAGVDIEPFDAKKGQEIAKIIADITFKTQVLNREFAGLPTGFPEILHGIEKIGDAALKTWLQTGKLPENLQRIADAQIKLNAAILRDEVKTPFTKYNEDLAKTQALLDAGAISMEEYTRKVNMLTQGLVEQTGVGHDLKFAADGIGQAFQSAFDSAIQDGAKAKDILLAFLKDINTALTQAFITKPIAGFIKNSFNDQAGGGWLNSLFAGKDVALNPWVANVQVASAKGNAFHHGRVMPFAKGGIINGPMMFPLGGGAGLAGEAGPEAIMPLERGADGKLGLARGGDTTNNYIDARGADIGAYERLERGIMETERRRPGSVADVDKYSRRFPFRRS